MCLSVVLLLSRGSTVIIYSAVIHAGMLRFQLKPDDVMAQGCVRSSIAFSFLLTGRAVGWLSAGELFWGAPGLSHSHSSSLVIISLL